MELGYFLTDHDAIGYVPLQWNPITDFYIVLEYDQK